MRNVIKINAVSPITTSEVEQSKINKKRVAGYARVSTDHEEQTTSYESQMKYYTDYISSRSDWEFVKMYSDEGISGTNTKLRVGFKTMIEDALNGKIDLIITKSVSRFARNTVDSLTTVRKLKEAGVEVYFEKENIWTLDSKGELLITIMSSLAQEESRSISENVTWGLRKQFAEGKVHFPYTNVLGFKMGENGQIEIEQDEAKTVRYIFQQTLLGKTAYHIAKDLTKQGIVTPTGKEKWNAVTIKRMLRNEKYKGDALLQKTYTVDFLTKKKNINKGELPQYYVENNHEAIVDKETFDAVQLVLDKKEKGKSSTSIFSSKLVCGDCGHYFGSKVWHSTSKYRRVIYRCNEKYKGEKKCSTPHVTEEELKQWFIIAINQVIENKDEIIRNLELIKGINSIEEMETKVKELETEADVISRMVSELVAENATLVQDQDEYELKYNQLSMKYENLVEEIESLEKERLVKIKRQKELDEFLKLLNNRENFVNAFDVNLWEALVENVKVLSDKKVIFRFKSGTEVAI